MYEIRTKQGGVKRRVLSEVLRRVVEAAAPEKIILFGSAARGEMGPDSDLDLLVVKGGKFNRDRLIDSVYRRLQGVRTAVDVVIVTPEEVDRYRDTHCLVICPALREGKVVYGSQAKGGADRRGCPPLGRTPDWNALTPEDPSLLHGIGKIKVPELDPKI